MASHFEVFDKLRDLGRSLDRISSVLPSEKNAEDINKARACLQLKALLADAKNLQEETAKTISDAKCSLNIDSILEATRKQALKIRENIDELEDHLTKYGYSRPKGKLPDVYQENDCEDSESNLCTADSSQDSSSDKENESPDLENEEPSEDDSHEDEIDTILPMQPERPALDPLVTPVRPKTATKFIQNYDMHKKCAASPVIPEGPPLPQTKTPVLKCKPHGFDFSVPVSSESPPHLMIETETIDKEQNFNSPTQVAGDLPVDDFPTPPTFTTPGLKRYGTQREGKEPILAFDNLDTPQPPKFKSVNRLIPGEMTGQLETSDEIKPCLKSRYRLPEIDYPTYSKIPGCLQKQFSFKQVNFLIEETNNYLNTREKGNNKTITNDELSSVLNVGPFTQAFALVLLKLEHFTMRKSGVYNVNDAFIV